MTAVTIHSDFGALENKVPHYFHCFPIYLPWSDGTDAMILVFWMLSFKPSFSLSSFTFIKRFFGSSLPSPIRVVSSAYLRLLIFLLAILIPVCASSGPAFLMMYSAYNGGSRGPNPRAPHESAKAAPGKMVCEFWDEYASYSPCQLKEVPAESLLLSSR